MIPLKDINWEKLFIGLEVMSSLGNLGKIIELDYCDDYTIVIEWNNGNKSVWYHHLLDEVYIWV